MEQLRGSEFANHKLQVTKRSSALVTGVKNVVSFHSKEIVLETMEGTLQFRGEGLHVKRLTLEKGEVDLDGKIDSMVYSDQQMTASQAGSFLGRLFR